MSSADGEPLSAEEKHAFEQAMIAAGIYDAKVMTWYATDDEILQELCAIDCRTCCAELHVESFVHCWGEPFKPGSTHVAITCFCSTRCVTDYVMHWVAKAYPDFTPDVLISFHAMNYTEEP